MTITMAGPVAPELPVATPLPAPRRRRGAGGAVLCALLVLHAVVFAPPLSPVRAAIALPIVLILPGRLLLHVLGGRWRGWAGLLHAVPLSLAVLMASGLVLGLLPGRQLSTGACLAAFDVATVLLAAAGWARTPRPPAGAGIFRTIATSRPPRGTAAALVGVGAGGEALILVVGGAARLDAGGSPAAAMAGLACAVVAFAAAVVAAHRRRTGAAATAIYLAGLAVLLATSLRGTAVTGHDIKIEYRVFLDTLVSGSWNPGGPYPGYTSCLSITVLPAVLAKLLGIAALDVFRVCFQIVFALVPVGAFRLARRLLRPAYAALSAGLFIAFPTFVNDMPMLNRQAIALLFFTTGLLILLDGRAPGPRRTILLLITAAGLTVSHYSSAGVCAALLLLAWLVYRLRRPRAAGPLPERVPPGPGAAAATMVALVLGWSALSGSGSAFAADLAGTARAVVTGAPVHSVASGYAPGRAKPTDDTTALREYLTWLTAERSAVGARPAPEAAAPVVLPADELPTTALGYLLADAGISPAAVNKVVRQAVVLLYEGGAVLGCLLLWLRLRRPPVVPRPALRLIAEWALASLALLAVAVVAPQITDSYGLLRLYQQLLPVLGVTVVVVLTTGTALLSPPWWTGRVRGVLVAAVVVAVLLTTSGLLPRATGAFPPQLNLANAGPYYRAYLAGSADVAMADTVRAHVPAGAWLVADSRDTLNLRALAGRQPDEGIAPGAVPDDAWLLVTLDRPGEVLAVAVVGDRAIRYAFPLADVAQGRPLVAATADHLLYGPYGR